jgi:polar amino acid transport system substrate-binding protein
MRNRKALVLRAVLTATAVGTPFAAHVARAQDGDLATACRAAAGANAAAPGDVAPKGRLRVALNVGTPRRIQVDSASGRWRGVATELAKVLATRFGVPMEIKTYSGMPDLLSDLDVGEWDIAVSLDPSFQPTRDLDYTVPLLETDNTYLVPSTAPLWTSGDLDRAGIRIAVAAGSATDLFLSSHLKRATLIRAPTVAAALELLHTQRVQAFAGGLQAVETFVRQRPGYRALADYFMVSRLAVAVPRGHEVRAACVADALDWARRSGRLAQAVARAGLVGVHIASADPAP